LKARGGFLELKLRFLCGLPVEIGSEIETVNLAESFMADGGLPAGTYAVMSKVGEKYVFYAPV
jgi:hypothetical protein